MPSYKDLLGMYKVAIARGVNIIATNEGELSDEKVYEGVHKNLLRIIDTIDGPMTFLDDNISILEEELEMYTEEERRILQKLHTILCSLPDIDKEIFDRYSRKEIEAEL